MDRREFLTLSAAAAAGLASARTGPANIHQDSPVTLDIGPGKSIRTVGYNGSVPGPILRLEEQTGHGRCVQRNRRAGGSSLARSGDRAPSMGPPRKARPRFAHGHRQYRFTPNPTGTRWYHTHSMAHADLSRAGFSGQFGFAIIEPTRHPGDYDRRCPSPSIIGNRRLGPWGLPTTAGKSCTNRPRSTAKCWAPASRYV